MTRPRRLDGPDIGPLRDALEAQADRAADLAVATPAGRSTGAGPLVAPRTGAAPAPHAASGGRPLDAPLRLEMERRFGHDFSRVRIHDDARAASAADAAEAKAYTAGHDIVFGEGRYAPGSSAGRRLVAHELAHVVQQDAGAAARGTIQRAPVFVDESCEGDRKQESITEAVAEALELVTQAIAALADPQAHARALWRYFRIDVAQPAHVAVLLDFVLSNVETLRAKLAGPVDAHCRGGMAMWGTRAYTERDRETGQMLPGVTYNRNVSRGRTLVDTIIHEYAHLTGIGHGEPDGETPSRKTSIKVRGLEAFEALNNAESYLRLVRAVT